MLNRFLSRPKVRKMLPILAMWYVWVFFVGGMLQVHFSFLFLVEMDWATTIGLRFSAVMLAFVFGACGYWMKQVGAAVYGEFREEVSP